MIDMNNNLKAEITNTQTELIEIANKFRRVEECGKIGGSI